jgi:hypothetical protein
MRAAVHAALIRDALMNVYLMKLNAAGFSFATNFSSGSS